MTKSFKDDNDGEADVGISTGMSKAVMLLSVPVTVSKKPRSAPAMNRLFVPSQAVK